MGEKMKCRPLVRICIEGALANHARCRRAAPPQMGPIPAHRRTSHDFGPNRRFSIKKRPRFAEELSKWREKVRHACGTPPLPHPAPGTASRTRAHARNSAHAENTRHPARRLLAFLGSSMCSVEATVQC